jgi:hypothetical protein
MTDDITPAHVRALLDGDWWAFNRARDDEVGRRFDELRRLAGERGET